MDTDPTPEQRSAVGRLIRLCLENRLPIIVFDLMATRSIERAVLGEPIGTLVSSEKEND